VTTVLLVGAGAVGVRAARQLVDTPGIEHVLVTARRAERAAELGRVVGAEPVPFGELPSGIDAVAVAVPGAPTLDFARRAVAAGVSVAAASDDADAVEGLLALSADARDRGATVAAGCALAPGLADVLARHAADALEGVDEIYVARAGVGGDACAAALRKARHDRPVEWRGRAAQVERRQGAELVWFPDPVGARECVTASVGVELLHEAVPSITRATVRAAEPPTTRRRGLGSRRRTGEDWGAARVEVWGWRDGARDAVVYGVIEPAAVAAGMVLAVAAARVSGLLCEIPLRTTTPGAYGLGALVEPAPFLAELARRGVTAAAFEGVVVA
jgi:hypothetical protein